MERGVWAILLLSGLFHFSTSLYRHKYYYINTPLPWPNAQQYCREKYTDLATISESWEVTELSLVPVPGPTFVFTGLYKVWGWSLNNVASYKETELVYSNWATGQPQSNQIFCGSFGATGKWSVTDCTTNLKFSCYNESATDISERFTVETGPADWSTAQIFCRLHGKELAKIQNQLENDRLQMLLNGAQAWIGLDGLLWYWSDGSEPTFLPWKPQEPLLGGVLDCAALHYGAASFGMLDAYCTTPQTFFCYNVPRGKTLVRLQLTAEDPSVDMKDPVVIESILRQMENRLENRMKVEDTSVTLSWMKLPDTENIIDKSSKHDCTWGIPSK